MIKSTTYNLQATSYQNGQAIIGSVIFLVLLSTVIIAGFVGPLTRELKSVRASLNSRQAYYASESGIEDAAYRIKNSFAYLPSYNLTVGSATAVVTVVSSGNTRTISTTGDMVNHQRKLFTQLTLSAVGVDLLYGIQVGDGGLQMENNSRVNGSVYSNGDIKRTAGGSAFITGDAIVAGGINPSPSVEWATHNATTTFDTSNSNSDAAQSFIAVGSDNLNKVAVYLAKTGNPATLDVRITTDNAGKPAISAIPNGNTAISASQVGTSPSWVSVSFASPPSLTDGTKYWIVLDGTTNSSNYWHWRKDSTDAYPLNTGKYISSNHNWSNNNAVWSDVGGDLAFGVWIGGVNTMIDGVTIGSATAGRAWANVFTTATSVHGANCPNEYCVIDNPSREELPLSDGVIQDWRDDAALGTVINGNLLIDTSTTTGPVKIDGDLTVTLAVDEHITITGTVWVTGNAVFNCGNGSTINLSPGYGTDSGLILVDGTIDVGNHCSFDGSPDPASYIMVLSAKNNLNNLNDPVLTVNNNSAGVVYYAGKGLITFKQNAEAKEATAYGIKLGEGATINYETGLGNLNFSSGPGGAFVIIKWREVE